MKTAIIIGTILSISLIACNQSKQETSNSNSVSNVVKLVKATNNIEDVDTIMKALKTTPPFTVEQLKTVFPENFNSINKTGYVVQNVLGAQSIETTYKLDKVNYTVKILDGAGEMGSSMAGMYLLDQLMNTEYQKEDGYKKPTFIQKIKGTESQHGKNSGLLKNEINLRVNNQIFLVVTASGIDMQELKKAIVESHLIENIERLKH